jgi:hypothetical protein
VSPLIPEILEFLGQLNQVQISYSLAHNRDEAIMVLIAVPGERWEVEFFSDGSIEVEVFVSSTGVHGPEALTRLFQKFSDIPQPG